MGFALIKQYVIAIELAHQHISICSCAHISPPSV